MKTTAYLFLLTALHLTANEPEAHLPLAHPQHDDHWAGHLHAEWDSRYFSEGRDNLDGDALWTSRLEMEWKYFTGGIWYGNSPERDYDELQMTVGMAETWGDFEVYGTFTHLRFLKDDDFDNEIAAGVNWQGLPLEIELAAQTYYSFGAEGWFCELALNREFEITKRLRLVGSTIYGMNFGYVEDGHDGANNLALRLSAEFSLTRSLSITAHSAYSWALSHDPHLSGDEFLIDFFHGGIGLQFEF